MRVPAAFPHAARVGYALMFVVYTATTVIAYGSFGSQVPGFLPDALKAGVPRQVVGLLLTFHIGVAYLITAQPLHRAIHAALFPRTLLAESAAARLHWGAISIGYLILAFALANFVPFFADVQVRAPAPAAHPRALAQQRAPSKATGTRATPRIRARWLSSAIAWRSRVSWPQALIGSMVGASIIFGWPAVFFLRASKLAGVPVAPLDALLCTVFAFVATVRHALRPRRAVDA